MIGGGKSVIYDEGVFKYWETWNLYKYDARFGRSFVLERDMWRARLHFGRTDRRAWQGISSPGFGANGQGGAERMILIFDKNRLDGTTLSSFPAGIFEIIGNVVFNLRDDYVALHFEDFRTNFNASLATDAQFFIHPYSHASPLDGVWVLVE
jgi:hypothetical protein